MVAAIKAAGGVTAVAADPPRRMKTLPIGLQDLQSRVLTNWPVLLSGMSIAALPMIVLFVCAQGRFVRGVEPVQHREEEEGIGEDEGRRLAVP